MGVMSVAEMKEIIKAKIDLLSDENVEVIFNEFDSIIRPSIDEIYKDAVAQYGDTLRKLAQ